MRLVFLNRRRNEAGGARKSCASIGFLKCGRLILYSKQLPEDADEDELGKKRKHGGLVCIDERQPVLHVLRAAIVFPGEDHQYDDRYDDICAE